MPPRPSQRTQRQRAQAAKAGEAKPVMIVEVNGERYEVRPGSWSWRDEQELYALTNLGWPRVVAEIQSGNPSPFMLGCLLFLTLRGRGEAVTFDEAQNRIPGDADVEINPPEPPAGEDIAADDAPVDPPADGPPEGPGPS